MKNEKYIVKVKMSDGSEKEFVSSEIHEVGSSFAEGEVVFCWKLSKKYVDY